MVFSILVSCGLLFSSVLNADTPFNPYERVESHRVYDFIQHDVSQRVGQARFAAMPSKEIKIIIDSAQNILYGPHLKGNQTFTKGQIHSAVDQACTQRAVQMIVAYARANHSSTLLSPEAVGQRYEEKIKQECAARPTADLFGTYYDPAYIARTFRNYHDQRQAELLQEQYNNYGDAPRNFETDYERSSQEPSFFSWLLNNLFSGPRESVPTPSNQRPASTPEVNNSPTKFFPQVKCLTCLRVFQEENLPSYYLPCGHNLCDECIQSYPLQDGKCLHCNKKIENFTSHAKRNLSSAIEHPNAVHCVGCNTPQIEINTLFTHLRCGHYICLNCKPIWKNIKRDTFTLDGITYTTDFAHECPRCHQTLGTNW